MIKGEIGLRFVEDGEDAIDNGATVNRVNVPTRRNVMNMMVSAAALTAASMATAEAMPNAQLAPRSTTYHEQRSVEYNRPPSRAAQLWEQRQALLEKGNELHLEWLKAREQLPDWCKSGPKMIAHDGTYCGVEVGWPMDPDVQPSSHVGAVRVCRVSAQDIRDHFSFSVETFALSGKARAKARANMRESMRKLVARLRAKKIERERLGLDELETRVEQINFAQYDIEDVIRDGIQDADSKAGTIILCLQEGASQSATAEADHGMKIACIALEMLTPQLTGLIAEHVSFFLSHRETPLREMPFALN